MSPEKCSVLMIYACIHPSGVRNLHVKSFATINAKALRTSRRHDAVGTPQAATLEISSRTASHRVSSSREDRATAATPCVSPVVVTPSDVSGVCSANAFQTAFSHSVKKPHSRWIRCREHRTLEMDLSRFVKHFKPSLSLTELRHVAIGRLSW